MITTNNIFTYFPLLASIGVFVTCWNQIKGIGGKIFNLFIIKIQAEDLASKALKRYLTEKSRVLTLGDYRIDGQHEYVKPVKKKVGVIFSLISRSSQIYILDGKPLIILDKKGDEKQGNTSFWADDRINIFLLRFTFNPAKLIENAINYYNETNTKENERFFIRQMYGFGNKTLFSQEGNEIKSSSRNIDYFANKPYIWNPKDLGYTEDNKESIFNNYVFCEQTTELFNRIKRWKNSKEWYDNRGIPWRNGALIYGRPGSGKSFSIKTICQLLDLPLFIFDLASLSNRELIEKWQECQNFTPCAVLFEDIDGIWKKRENLNKDIAPSFDCFLNCIGGALPCNGVISFITTNKLDYLDEALGIPDENNKSSRPGRLDLMIKLNFMSEDNRNKLANIILKDNPELISNIVKETEGFTAAQCAEKFSNIALTEYWKNK